MADPDSLPKNNPIRVWFTDDNSLMREIMPDVINQSDGLECVRCDASCGDLLQALAHTDAPPDVLLLDIEMPGMSGVEAIPRIKELAPTTKIIMLTSHTKESYVHDSFAGGAHGYLLKPIKPEQVLAAIKNVMSGGVSVHPAVMQKLTESPAANSLLMQKYNLTAREEEILGLLAKGMNRKEIAEHLNLMYNSVESYCKSLHDKMKVHTDLQLAVIATRQKLPE